MSVVQHSITLFRAVAVVLCCLGLVTVLGGGSSCSFSSSHGSHDRHDDDSDDNELNASAPDESVPGDGTRYGTRFGTRYGTRYGTGSARLTEFAVDLDPRAGHHPIARLRDIQGLSVFDAEQRGVVGADDFSHFTTRVIAENQDLLGLPAAAGQLAAGSVQFMDETIVVVHEQVPGDDAEMVFAFDLLGRLLQIDNRTTLPPGVVVTVPEGLLPTR